MKIYPATIEATTHGYMISIKGIPEAVTEGDTLEEALSLAEDVLLETKRYYDAEKLSFPMPAVFEPGDAQIRLKHGLTKQPSNARKGDDLKESWIQIRVDSKQKAQYVKNAKSKGLKLSEYVLQTLDNDLKQTT